MNGAVIAANGNQTPDVAIHFTRAIQFSIRMFIVGIALPLAAWEIAAAEFDRSNAKVRLLESWAVSFADCFVGIVFHRSMAVADVDH
jgi:hypothetical protein